MHSHDRAESNQAQQGKEGLEVATFAAGNFWCAEEIFEEIRGVKEVETGYAGGTVEDPTYKQVDYGHTDHAFCIQIFYNPREVTYTTLLDVFFMAAHNPTTLNKQGPDEGRQYRSVIFYRTETEKRMIAKEIHMLNECGVFKNVIVTQVKAMKTFYRAEKSQQDFCTNNPENIYVRGVCTPKINRFRKQFRGFIKTDYNY